MGKDKKKRKALRKDKAQEFHQIQNTIHEENVERSIRSKYKIPGSVAIPTIEEDLLQKIGQSSFSLIFHYYNHNICALTKVNTTSQAEQIVKILDNLSKSTPNNVHDLIRDSIHRKNAQGDYARLFSSLPEDTEIIHESSFCDEGRVFFFTINGIKQNFACVVSINPLHLS
ncbi:hypothetical protein KBC79_00295 [Candidatus Woesebacteria bacterium]|nr:hypothetical protein [Candidatus Woesebacteria bacterium]